MVVSSLVRSCRLRLWIFASCFEEHRIHLYRHRVQVRWGGGDPRMVFADGEVFVGIAPLGRVRKMEDIETLLKEHGILPSTQGGSDGEL
mmetsp:Transcript_21301/g.34426  ORF Transcript_21301/g.34426 Transcript_21301/m.34426 type:complete len:89 (+) Transcript_21301:435-701(+)